MKRSFQSSLLHCLAFLALGLNAKALLAQSEASMALAVLQYRGGGDWYVNPTSLPNLTQFCTAELGIPLAPARYVDVASPELYDYPFVHMTGHGNVVFNAAERENLRNYLLGGGFLHIDDNYGMDVFIRPQIAALFPDKELVEVPFDHPIYHQPFEFSSGLPKIHEHDGKAPQGFGIFHEGRLLLFYSYETDLGDGWDDPSVHNDPEAKRQAALRMGANLVQYAFMGEPAQ